MTKEAMAKTLTLCADAIRAGLPAPSIVVLLEKVIEELQPEEPYDGTNIADFINNISPMRTAFSSPSSDYGIASSYGKRRK